MKRFSLILLVLAAGLMVVSSCGPIRATSALSDAKDELYKARLAGADDYHKGGRYDTKAQYDYFLAVEYVEKSKVFLGFSEFDAAEHFSLDAARLAREAVKLIEDQKRKIEKKCVQPKRVP